MRAYILYIRMNGYHYTNSNIAYGLRIFLGDRRFFCLLAYFVFLDIKLLLPGGLYRTDAKTVSLCVLHGLRWNTSLL